MAAWQKVGENLVRHSGGTIYLRGRVDGKPIRVSLKTKDLRIAKIARDAKLEQLREAVKSVDLTGAKTMGELIDVLAERSVDQPHLKPATKEYYAFIIGLLRGSIDTSVRASNWTATDSSKWWREFSQKHSAQCVNNTLSFAKKLGDLMKESGQSLKNPFSHLRRVAIVRNSIEVPTSEQLNAVIESIKSQKLPHSQESANFVRFLAYSGLRLAEASAVLWKDVSDDWIMVTGGKKLTKNRKFRKVPISEPLRELLASMRSADTTPQTPLFTIVNPRIALQNACKRLKIPHIHPHLLRHYFATWAIERGVDIPTVSRWLGHSDGGVLAMKTYGHIRDDHSLEQIKKL